MSAISLKSITGITSITTPAGVDDQLTLHNNNTTEAVKLDVAGNVHINNQLAVAGITTFSSNAFFGNNVRASFASNSRLQIHSNGTNSYLDYAGSLNVRGNSGSAAALSFLSNSNVLVSNNLEISKDLDVDGHTNLDNVSIAGFTTISSTLNGEIFRIETSAGNPGGTQGLAYMGFDHFPASTKPAILIGSEEAGNASYMGNFVIKLKDAAATDDDPVQRFKIDSSGRVMIGRASAYGSADADNLIVGDEAVNEHQGITILSHSGKYGGIYFGDGSGSNPAERGKIIYDHPNDQLRIGTGGSAATQFYINSVGEVGISVSPASGHLLHIKNAGTAEAKVKIESESGYDARLILDTSNGGGAGAHIDFQIDGTAKGGIQYVTNGSASDQHDIIFRGNNYTEKLRIDSSGRMIIGTNNTVNNAVWYDDITINNSNGSGNTGGAGIDLVSSDDSYGGIIFSDNSAYEQGYIKYVHNSNYDFMKFGTNSNDRWQLTKDGHWSPITNNVYDIGSNSLKVRNVSIAGTMTSGRATITGTTTAVRNSGVSTATGSIIYNSNLNALEVYNGSEWKAISAKASSFNVSYLVVGGGGGGGGYFRGGGGGAGALRTNMSGNAQGGGQSTAPAKSISIGTAYSIIIGAGGQGNYNANGSNGGTSTFDDIVSNGGTGGARYERDANTNTGNGCGGGGGGHTGTLRAGGAGGTYGYAGGNGSNSGSTQCGGGGGGAAAAGGNGGGGGTDGDGGAALTNTITGSTVAYAGGAGGGNYGGGNQTIGGGAGAPAGGVGSGGAPGQNASIPNRGSGGGGAGGSNVSGGTGSAGVIILRFPSTYTATVTGGVTSSTATVGTDTVLTITATDNSSQTVTFA